MTYKLTNELKQLVNNITVGKYDLIDKMFDCDLCKDIQLKFAKDGFIDIYNNNISKYVCIDNEERVQ